MEAPVVITRRNGNDKIIWKRYDKCNNMTIDYYLYLLSTCDITCDIFIRQRHKYGYDPLCCNYHYKWYSYFVIQKY